MKKKYVLSALLLSLVLVLAACGNANDKDEATNDGAADANTAESAEKMDDVTISFMIPDWGAPTDEMLKEFKDETGITVDVIPTGWDDIREKVATAAAGKQIAADVFELDWSWVGEFQSADWLLPIEVSEEDKADMPTLETFSVDGKAYGMPYANDFRIAYYNKEMFDKVGADEPKTWDDVFEASKKLKDEGICEYPFAYALKADESTSTSLMWLAYTRNGGLFNDDNTINQDALKDGLETVDTFMQAGLIDPANAEISGQMAYAKILSGDAAFMVGPSSYVTRIDDAEQSEVVGQVKPIVLPGKEAPATATVPFAEGVGISNYTEHPEAAKKWVEWYTSKKNQEKMFEELSTLPTRNSVLNELVDSGAIKDSGAMVELSKMIESPFPNGVPKNYTEMSTEIFNTTNQMTSGKLSADQAADKIKTAVDDILAESK
ncbi:MAG: sugar ABC transporter substrate-binding protein [Peptoniphilus sp.]|nr:sugar ABC transporter substrate-binding protein [Peptoniphilus sp.]MDD7363023.1 sugar ABC transporter substrate-binding protein [Bacillota bacterium]MDY6045288.1 sugar ABC transporter substrate-binding protein [Peptoniphilus sp.]